VKYTILINQAGIVAAGLGDKTDFSDWAILEYVAGWQVHSGALRYGDHIWLNYSKLMDEMPMLGIRTKAGVSKRLGRLRDLGLLSSMQTDDNRLYVKVTDLYLGVVAFRPGESVVDEAPKRGLKQPVHVCEDEQGVNESEQGVNESEQGVNESEQGVNCRKRILNNKNKLLKQTKHYAGAQGGEKPPDDDQVLYEPLQWAQFFIRECDYPMHIVQTAKTIPMFAQWVSEKTTVGEIRQAMAACHGWNNGRVPDSPLLYGKFLQSVREARQRLADESAFAARPGGGKARTEDWARIPREDEALDRWARQHGYPGAGIGVTYRQYRAQLQAAVGLRLQKAKAG
jgi:hypothetical protein